MSSSNSTANAREAQDFMSARVTLTLKRATPITAVAPDILPPVPLDAGHFWILWRAPDGQRPKKRHGTLEAAIAERDRLQAACPGADFRIFEAREVSDGRT